VSHSNMIPRFCVSKPGPLRAVHHCCQSAFVRHLNAGVRIVSVHANPF
jgi:hypothetical protein